MNSKFSYNEFIPIHDHEVKDKTLEDLVFSELMFYDYYELFDETKYYPVEEFECEFIPGRKRRYIFRGLTFSYKDVDNTYVVAYEIISPQERKILQKYCQCEKHKMSFLNPRKYFLCSCCIGCLEYENPSQKVIWMTRKFITK